MSELKAFRAQSSGKPLKEILEQFTAEAIERFPHLKGQLLVVDMNEYEAFSCWDIDEKKTGLTPVDAMTYIFAHPNVVAMKDDKNARSCAFFDNQKNLNIILYNDHVDESQFSNISEQTEKNILYILDHELAHLAINNGLSADGSLHAKVVAESVADAYALIRQYQRYGVNHSSYSDYVDTFGRSHALIWGDEAHFTNFVMEEITKRKNLIDFKNLDPQQTSELAWRFAAEYAPSSVIIESLNKTFEPVKKAFAESQEAGVKTLINIAVDPDSDYYAFKFASRWLKRYLVGDRLLFPTLQLPQEYLDAASKKLKERKFKLAQEDILFNIPIVSPKRPTNTVPKRVV